MRSIRRLAAFSLSLAMALMVIAPSAQAGLTTGVNDPNDTRGKLDVDRFEGVRTVSGGAVTYKISFHDAVKNKILQPRGNFIKIMIDTDGDNVADYTGSMGFGGGSVGIWFSSSDAAFEPLAVTRPNPRTFKFVTPAGDPLSPNGPLGAKAITAFTSDGGWCIDACLDEVPNTGAWIAL